MVTDDRFDSALDRSRPNHVELDEVVRASLDQMIAATVAGATAAGKPKRTSWRRPLFLIPAIGALAIATTAGAIAYSFSTSDAVVIPINYTTANGHHISCGYGVSAITQTAGESTAAFRSFVKSHDWTGTGQKVYEYAIAHPYVPTAEEVGEFTPRQIDSFSFSEALAAVIGDQIPASVEPAGYLGGGESDCTGTLR